MEGNCDRKEDYEHEARKIELEQQILDVQARRLGLEEKRIELEIKKLELDKLKNSTKKNTPQANRASAAMGTEKLDNHRKVVVERPEKNVNHHQEIASRTKAKSRKAPTEILSSSVALPTKKAQVCLLSSDDTRANDGGTSDIVPSGVQHQLERQDLSISVSTNTATADDKAPTKEQSRLAPQQDEQRQQEFNGKTVENTELDSTDETNIDGSPDDIGYLLLEDCEVNLLPTKERLKRSVWMDCELCDDNDQPLLVEGNDCCTRGELIVRCDKTLRLTNAPRFDGSVQDMHHHSSKCGAACTRTGKRSDASLLLGLALSCRDVGHVRISSVRIMFRDVDGPDTRNGLSSTPTQRCRAALLVSFSGLDEMAAGASFSPGRKKRTISKALPPATQLLLSLVRSDWDQLTMKQEELKRPIKLSENSTHHFDQNGKLRRSLVPFFPPKLSLEELYTRIRASAKSCRMMRPPPSSPLVRSIQFLDLPLDVISTNVAPYLRARSLDSLRSSCLYLQTSLSHVVPGMKLKLYSHQVNSLSWMRQRETLELTENSCVDSFFSRYCYGGDAHRAVTGGASVCLTKRGDRSARIRMDQQYGRQLSNEVGAGDNSLARKVVRGGLLCDDPGLGKTITVLSLVLQTMGLTSEPKAKGKKEEDASLCSDDSVFLAYWKEEFPKPFQESALLKIMGKLYRSHRNSLYFDYTLPEDCAGRDDILQHPIDFNVVKDRIKENVYAKDFTLFETDIRICFQNAMRYYPAENCVYETAKDLDANFLEIVSEFKTDQIKSAKKSFSNATAKPNSSVAAILERKARRDLISSMIPSAATLLVVPNTLLDHWEEQISLHVDTSYCTSKEPVIFKFTGNDMRTRAKVREIRDACQDQQKKFPFVFIDMSPSQRLPDAEFLAMFSIVLTTTQRFTNEWRHGSFEEELRDRGEADNPYISYANRGAKKGASPFLKVHWTRMIVDEGHSMGRGKKNSSILFAAWISAQRRWAMTGTPTPQTVSRSGLSNLLGLMGFLQHDFFTSRLHGDHVWATISRAWGDGKLSAFYRLRSLLEVLMVRHTKLDIEELPRPKFDTKMLPLSAPEVKAYNTLVSAVQSNLLLTAMIAKVSGEQDSLLHRSQAKHARKALSNIRLSCCGGTRVIPVLESKSYDETMVLLKSVHNLPDVKVQVIKNYLRRACEEELSSCMLCGIQLSTLLLVPCGDLICTECMTSQTRCCLVCDEPFDADDFQRLQPGMIYTWHWNIEDIKKGRTVTNVANVAEDEPNNVIEPPVLDVAPRRRTRRRGDGHQCEYDPTRVDGKCRLCLEEHDECVMMDLGAPCNVCFRRPEPCPSEETKFYHIVSQLEQLHASTRSKSTMLSLKAASVIGENIDVAEERPLKAIVFSQFRNVLNLVGHRLLRRFGAGAVAEFWGSYRKQELKKFQCKRDCFCMLLGKDGSEGLDLSFVTHIFFLEEVWDKSLENQTVARAWRMGAKGDVKVQILVAQNSVEQMMTELEEILSDSNGREESLTSSASSKEYQRARLIYLLKNVKLIHPRIPLKTAVERPRKRKHRAGQTARLEVASGRKVARVKFSDEVTQF